MDYYVANYLLSTLSDVDDFVLDPNLPVTTVEFCLSTLNNPELVADISEFIAQHPDVVAKLKAQYGLDDPTERLKKLRNQKGPG